MLVKSTIYGPTLVVVLSMTIYLYFRAPCIFLTMVLNAIGGVDIMMAPLLAHEFGHLMGSYHDGDNMNNAA